MVGTWVKRSLRYYAARHVVFAGTVALTSAILCAALLTGESLQEGLRRGLRERLGRVRSAAVLGEGVFPASLAERLPEAQAALLLRGELLTAAGEVCAADAQVIGVAGVGAGEWSAARNARAAGLLAAGLAGLLPARAVMQKRLAGLGLQGIALPEGLLRGHTFHHSRLETDLPPLARADNPNGGEGEAVYRLGRLTASYVHFYFPSNPEAAAVLFLP